LRAWIIFVNDNVNQRCIYQMMNLKNDKLYLWSVSYEYYSRIESQPKRNHP